MTAALLMVLAAASFVGMTSTAKALSADLSTPEIVWGRYTTHFVIVLVLLRFRFVDVVRTERPGTQLLRSLLMFGATVFSFLAVRYLPLADFAAIMFLTPMIVTALAALILSERVGLTRWSAVALGFLGALVIIRPGVETVQFAALAALLCAASYASYQITTRVVGDTAPPLVSLFYSCLVGTLVSTAALPWFWSAPDAREWVLMITAGVFGALGHLAMIAALARAQASFVSPFSYTQLIWATLLGYALFGDFPDLFTFVGAVLIAASGLYLMRSGRSRAASV